MEKSKADAIAQAILEPELKAQDEISRKRATEARRLAKQRLVALFALPGFAIGAVIAYLMGNRISYGAICGGMAGVLLGWAVVGLRRHRSTP